MSVIDAGHEVGRHSVTHPKDMNFPSLSKPQKEIEIGKDLKNSHNEIMSNLTGQTLLSISCPFGKGRGSNDSIVCRVAKKYYNVTRYITAGTANADAYNNFQNTWFTAFGRDYDLQTGGILMNTTTSKTNIDKFITVIIKINVWFIRMI